MTMTNIVNFLSEIIIILVGGYLIYINLISIKYFIAFSSYSKQFSNSLMNITNLNGIIQQSLVSIKRIFNMINNKIYGVEEFGVTDVQNINGKISFDNVSFQYDKNNLVLKDVFFNINKNSKTAIVGKSGSGKTTILNLIMKFYSSTSGTIKIDGINIDNLSEKCLCKNISIVSQNSFLFNGSIKENIMISNTDAINEEIEEACKKAYIHDFITGLPDKYDSIIEENSVNLSGGQKQRISIARALLKRSKIIIFDEATASLDNEAQYFIKKAIDSICKDHTVIIVEHKL